MTIVEGLTLFTSDSRPKYTNDALAVLALPAEVEYQFRYECKYIPSTIQNYFENQDCKDTKLLICFKSQISNFNHFIVPIRWATLVEVSRITDFYILRFKLNTYPILKSGTGNLSFTKICEDSTQFLNSMSGNNQSLPVLPGLTPFVEPLQKEGEEAWFIITKALAECEIFKNIHFLKVSKPFDEKNIPLQLNSENQYEVEENRYLYVKVDYYALNFDDRQAFLKIVINSQLIRLASNSQIQLDSRYDHLKIWFQILPIVGDSFEEIEIATSDKLLSGVMTKLKMQIAIKKSKTLLYEKILLSVLAGVFISIPGIFGNLNGFIKITSSSFGTLILAIGLNLLYPKKRINS